MRIDATEMVEFVADIEGVRGNIGPHLRSAFEVTSRHIKNDWNKGLRREGTNRMRNVGSTVDYDIEVEAGLTGSSISSEIGPNLGKPQGSFAGWFEEGSAGVPATHSGEKALKKWESDLEDGIVAAGVDALLRAIR